MAHIRIEIDRGQGWKIRQEGFADISIESLKSALPAYALQYPHRAYFNGELVAEIAPSTRNPDNAQP